MNRLRMANAFAALFVGVVVTAGPAAVSASSADKVADGQAVELRAFDQANLRYGGPGPDAGREAQTEVVFPDGNWVKVEVTLTLNSYATPGLCSYPNPTGDIYD